MFAIKALAVVAVLAAAGCAANPAPHRALPDARDVFHEPYGAYVVAERTSRLTLQGELIAASTDTLWVLHEDGLRALARDDLRRATVALYSTRNVGYGTWVALGTLATISNGWFLVFSAPMWLIGGSWTTARLSRQPLYSWSPKQQLADLAPYARYPAGIPETLDRTTLVLPAKMRQ